MAGAGATLIAGGAQPGGAESPADPSAPWWEHEKIRFMWGQWKHAREDRSTEDWWNAGLPERLFRNVAQAGATVYTELRGYDPRHARLAHKYGMRYFATRFVCDLSGLAGDRTWVKADEEHSWPCSLDEPTYESWLAAPHVEGLNEGLIDGIHVDWEAYGGRGEAGICYCDLCFAGFPGFSGMGIDLPARLERFQWLEERDLVRAYEADFSKRRVEMFTRIGEKLRAIRPNLLFSSYNMLASDFSQAMHAPSNPFIVLDARHYYNHNRQPWWESYGAHLRELGYLYIPGGWTNALFGAQASDVSAARWIYEASINADGCWLWFERELDDEILRAYATADREIQGVLRHLGDFLFGGQRDDHFVAAVEWTGRPELEQSVRHCTYHLGEEHLVHVNNVDCDWPLRVRLRFPRLPEGDRWVVRDALRDLAYTRDGASPAWPREGLRAGLVVALEPRSDLFLCVSPADESVTATPADLLRSREFDTMPGHAAAAQHASTEPHAGGAEAPPARTESAGAGAAAASAESGASGQAPDRLLYTATEPMGLEGPEGPLSIANSIRVTDPEGGDQQRLRQLRGHLWSPSYSPDGKRIAFVHDAGGRGQIHVMNADGSAAANVSGNEFCDRSPVWSPDVSRLAFTSDRAGDWDIYVMNADGSDQRRVAGNSGLDRAPAWSPDGAHLAWESHASGMPNVWICSSDGRDPHPLMRPDQRVSLTRVSPGREPYAVEPLARDNVVYLMDPVWSPDGSRIAAVCLNQWAQDVVLIAVDGSSLIWRSDFPYVGDVCWSPDGKRIAAAWRCGPQETERAGIVVFDADGADEQLLADVTPTGPRLGGGRRHGLLTWYSHGSAQPRRVVKTFTSLAWSPDGRSLAFSSDLDRTGAFHIYTMDPDGGEPQLLEGTRSAWPQQVMWRPGQVR